MAKKPRHTKLRTITGAPVQFSGKLFDCFGFKQCVGKNCRKKIPRVACKLAKFQAPAAPRLSRKHAPLSPGWLQREMRRDAAMPHMMDPEAIQERAAAMELVARRPGMSGYLGMPFGRARRRRYW